MEATSVIARVNLVRNGVVVTRVVEPLLGEAVDGQCLTVRVAGLPVGLVDASLAVTPRGGTSVRSMRLGLERAVSPRTDEDRVERQRALDAKLDALVAEGEELERSIAVLRGLRFPGRPAPTEGSKPTPSDVTARLALLAEVAEATRELVMMKARLAVDLERAEEEARAHAQQTAEAQRRRSFEKSLTLELERTGTDPCSLELSYFMRRARWVPTYVLRVDRARSEATIELRASIAQATGERWDGVALSLSTGDPHRFHELPELQSLRIGRKQPPKPTGFRPLTVDPQTLFSDYERTLATRRSLDANKPTRLLAKKRKEAEDREVQHRHVARDEGTFDAPMGEMGASSLALGGGGFGGPPGAAPMEAMPSASIPMPMSAARFAPQARGMVSSRPTMDLKARLGRASPSRGAAKGGFFSRSADMSDDLFDLEQGLDEAGQGVPEHVATDERVFAYESLRMPALEERRGKLVLLERTALYRELWASEEALDEASFEREEQAGPSLSELPARSQTPTPDEGFHHRLDGTVLVSVAADGQFHSVPILQLTTPVKLRHVVVPRESTDVFRRATSMNPLDVPLLAGPCDVYVDGEFLLTTDLETVGPRGELSIPMGVEQSIRVVRNTKFSEATEGLIGGTLALRHELSIEVQNHLPRSCELEVRERVPIPDEKDENVRVELGQVKPAWSSMRPRPREREVRGLFAWNLELDKDARAVLVATYVVRVPSKFELEGGNRRA